MNAAELTPGDVGQRVTFTTKGRRYSFVLGHVYVEQSDRRTFVLVRPEGGNLDTGISLDGRTHVELSTP